MFVSATNAATGARPPPRRSVDAVTFGPDAPNTARIAQKNVAQLYQALHRFAEAEPLYQRTLAILEQAFGAEHPNVAAGLENYALLLWQV